MANEPIISWFEDGNNESNEVVSVSNYGTVDADDESGKKTFYIWNNRNGDSDVSKMEEVTFTTRDRLGGTGDQVGNIVEAVRDNWFQVKVDSLDESSYTPVGKGGVGTGNESGVKAVGTNGSTININAETAVEWSASQAYDEGDYIKPTASNGFIYRVTVSGTTSGTEPVWTTTENNVVTDGTVEYIAIRIEVTPGAQEILGLANNTLADGSNAEDAGGNFVEITVYADVPINASAGKQEFIQRISYRYV